MTAIYKTMPAKKERRLKKLLAAVKWVSGISAFALMVLAYGALGSLETGVLSEAEAYPMDARTRMDGRGRQRKAAAGSDSRRENRYRHGRIPEAFGRGFKRPCVK